MLNELQEIIAEKLGLSAEEVQPEKSLKDDLKADSLDLFDLVTELEEKYEIEIPTEDLDTLVTVQDVIDYIEKR
ncbi:acyl carrier protein [Hominifimenecus microfluidus]|uniref:Acyl carrier protein n=1 Tax=Hominifimenecus microfluidus TaxID=2885348 RepID=A0AAE3ECS5_9FIRM|nr:acyl carrier protein [Hominifimenecus microfluidus]MCC2231500.1 acyl carrier protein [Hominifimenecus microfluidus]